MTTRRRTLGPDFSMDDATSPTAATPTSPAAPEVQDRQEQADLPPPPDVPTKPASELAQPAATPVAEPRTGGRDLAPVPETSDSASNLASLLAGSDNQHTTGGAGTGGHDRLVDAMTAPPPPPDPELDLVTLGVRIPQYMATALRTMAFLRHRRQQELVREALERYVPSELLARCRESAHPDRGRQ